MSKHTQGKWRVDSNGLPVTIRSCESAPRTIAILSRPYPHILSEEENLANAEHIVRCVNSHDELLALAEAVAQDYEDAADWKDAFGKLQRMAKSAIQIATN